MGHKKKKKRKGIHTGRETDCRYIAYTDGGCAFNPGGPGGCGVLIIDSESGEIVEKSEGFKATTNNRMEIMAVIMALSEIPDGTTVMLHSDSQYVLNTIAGNFQISANMDLWNRLFGVMQDKKVYLQWIKGHNGNPYNERCDELAALAMTGLNLQTDNGYIPSQQRKATGGSMAVHIQIPEGVQEFFDTSSSKHVVKVDCADAIKKLNKITRPSFKDYAVIKTGGIDGWSRVKEEELRELCGNNVCDVIDRQFPQNKNAVTVMRWYCRGLSLTNAIRKVLVDDKISKNALNAKNKKKY